MKICLVTAFPPSLGGLSEYGLHIAEELRRNPLLSVKILADRIPDGQPELEGFSVERCWSFDDPGNPVELLRAIRRLKPDVVWFNLLFSTFGRKPWNAFLGLLTPLLARLSGRYTHVTLHHLMDTVDLKDAGVRHARVYKIAGSLATRILLLSNSVSVLMPGYRKILHEKYGRDNVHLRSHGILTRRPEFPDMSRRGDPTHRILAFGKWGTYKRLELMIEAFATVADVMPNARLVIAGGDHPQAPGYVESMKKKYAGERVEFTGYVHEDDLPSLFQTSSVAVMPYSSSTGCSGVAHLACAYGVPILCADLPDFRQMGEGEELAMEFYRPGEALDLARSLISLLSDREKQQAMSVQNFSTALRMTMPTIVQKYVRHFELDQRSEALRQVTRFRRLPGWVPSKSLMLRLMTRKTHGWVQRSVIAPQPRKRTARQALLDRDVDGGGKLGAAGFALNGNRVSAVGGWFGAAHLAGAGSPAAGNGHHGGGENSEQREPAGAAWSAAHSEQRHADRQQAGGEERQQAVSRVPANGAGRSRSDGQSGTGGAAAGGNGTGRERATQGSGEPAA
ncbi:MAG TPA: glycosyltransferase [Candidatus Binatia bacterium]|nr:glycosyltransferase [Candidatus Binatia bacterium]